MLLSITLLFFQVFLFALTFAVTSNKAAYLPISPPVPGDRAPAPAARAPAPMAPPAIPYPRAPAPVARASTTNPPPPLTTNLAPAPVPATTAPVLLSLTTNF
jgi:hypothetical protein